MHHGDIRSKFGAQDRCQILITVGISEHAFGRGGHPVGKAIDFDTSSMGAQLRTIANNFPPISVLLVVSENFSGSYLNRVFSVQRKQLLVGIGLGIVFGVLDLGVIISILEPKNKQKQNNTQQQQQKTQTPVKTIK